MANTIAWATGYDKSRTKETHRLGSVAASVQAATWRTFACAYVAANGSSYVEVCDSHGQAFHRFDFGPEADRR